MDAVSCPGMPDHLVCRGVVHRDLKLENLLLVSGDDISQIKIADFGLAKKALESSLETVCGVPSAQTARWCLLTGKPSSQQMPHPGPLHGAHGALRAACCMASRRLLGWCSSSPSGCSLRAAGQWSHGSVLMFCLALAGHLHGCQHTWPVRESHHAAGTPGYVAPEVIQVGHGLLWLGGCMPRCVA